MANTDHRIVIEQCRNRVRVVWRGQSVADSLQALTLREATYPAVHYIPRRDVQMAFLERTSHQTRCPYKGLASYFSLKDQDGASENAVWTYESPIPSVVAIAGYLAFYPDRVDRIDEVPA